MILNHYLQLNRNFREKSGKYFTWVFIGVFEEISAMFVHHFLLLYKQLHNYINKRKKTQFSPINTTLVPEIVLMTKSSFLVVNCTRKST